MSRSHEGEIRKKIPSLFIYVGKSLLTMVKMVMKRARETGTHFQLLVLIQNFKLGHLFERIDLSQRATVEESIHYFNHHHPE